MATMLAVLPMIVSTAVRVSDQRTSGPVTRSSTTWVVVAPADPQLGGVYDLKSGAKGLASDGTPYEQW